MPGVVDILPYGERAVLLQVTSVEESLSAFHAVKELALFGVEDIVPASRTVLVSFNEPRELSAALPALQGISVDDFTHEPGQLVSIDVVYDGEDLGDVAKLSGLGIDDVIDIHSATTYTVAFLGFAPGFAYLIGLDERLQMPRRPSPRTKVPLGSVAIAGPFAAVYPRESPGGWRLLGRTAAPMWDLERDQPSLLLPGMQVRFTAVPR